MSKGNINYKYLRRRKNWFQRNWKALIIYIVLILAVLGAGAFVCIRFTPLGSKLGITQGNESKENKASPGEDNNAPGDGSNKNNGEQQTKEVTWIDLKEPEQQKEVSYTVPAGVAYPYHIKVNRAANCVTVYGIDESGLYSIPVKAFAASCGRAGEETITGENYKTSDMYVWRLMVDNTYGHYAYRISGGYLFHSVPYLKAANNTLETEEYNKLGTFASLGCVRMCVRDVLWLYENCPQGTTVDIYDDAANPGPLGKPESIKIPLDSPNAGWDPTDPDETNPWHKESATLSGVQDITVKVGDTVDFLKGVTAKDTCGNDITDKIAVSGRYTTDAAGEYTMKYQVTDAIGSTATAEMKLIVTK